MIRAFVVMLTALFTLATFFGAIVPALNPFFDIISSTLPQNPVVQNSLIGELKTSLYVFVPLIFGGGAILLSFLFAVRLRGTSGVRP